MEVALLLPLLLLLAMGVVDFGQLFHLAIEVSNAARAGAQYGYQSSATQVDTPGMIAAAEDDAGDVTTWGANTAVSYTHLAAKTSGLMPNSMITGTGPVASAGVLRVS